MEPSYIIAYRRQSYSQSHIRENMTYTKTHHEFQFSQGIARGKGSTGFRNDTKLRHHVTTSSQSLRRCQDITMPPTSLRPNDNALSSYNLSQTIFPPINALAGGGGGHTLSDPG